MRTVNYKDDFTLAMKLRSVAGEALGVPDFDFTVRLLSGAREFIAGRFEGELRNCRISEFDSQTLEIICDNHNLLPCPELLAEVTFHIPDGNYPDGIHDVTKRYHTHTALSAGNVCDCIPSIAEFEALLPFIKGDSLKYEDLTPEQLAELMAPFDEKLEAQDRRISEIESGVMPSISTEELEALFDKA